MPHQLAVFVHAATCWKHSIAQHYSGWRATAVPSGHVGSRCMPLCPNCCHHASTGCRPAAVLQASQPPAAARPAAAALPAACPASPAPLASSPACP